MRKVYFELPKDIDLNSVFESILTEDGKEHPNPQPLVLNVGPKPLSLQEQVERFMKNYFIKNSIASKGMETMEEADDFNVGDDDEPLSGFEVMAEDLPVTPPSLDGKPPQLESEVDLSPEGETDPGGMEK